MTFLMTSQSSQLRYNGGYIANLRALNLIFLNICDSNKIKIYYLLLYFPSPYDKCLRSWNKKAVTSLQPAFINRERSNHFLYILFWYCGNILTHQAIKSNLKILKQSLWQCQRMMYVVSLLELFKIYQTFTVQEVSCLWLVSKKLLLKQLIIR